MAIVVRNGGLVATVTGSLGLCFRVSTPDALPDDITIEAMPVGGAPEDLLAFEGLEILSDDSTEWKFVELTQPVKFGVEYDVAVKFDGVTVHSEAGMEIPSPGAARGAVLRQRMYETLLALYRAGEIEAKPYGDGQLPGLLDEKALKAEGGILLEVGNYFTASTALKGYAQRESQVSLPLRVKIAMDENSDVSAGSAEMENVIDQLLQTDWRMNGFGLFQSAATFDGEEPEYNEDRTIATITMTLSIPIRRQISRS